MQCRYNIFGSECFKNTFEINCSLNTFGENCISNTLGGGYNNNTFGNNCTYNTFGKNCVNRTLESSSVRTVISHNEEFYEDFSGQLVPIKHPEFVKDAYQHKMWAFVSDFARLWCIYNYGGIYFDTDVELISSVDNLPERFMAVELCTEQIALGLGFGAEKGNGVIKDILTTYENTKFVKKDVLSFLIPRVVTRYFYNNGYRRIRNSNKLNNCMGFIIYPPEYFCPKGQRNSRITITENTISIHHYEGSWLR